MESKSSLKIFISNCNSLLGYCLVDEFRNDHIETDPNAINQFVGTLDPFQENDPPPMMVQETVSFIQEDSFRKALNDSDVIIYHLPYSSPSEIRYITNCIFDIYYTIDFRKIEPLSQKTLILISTISVWDNNTEEI